MDLDARLERARLEVRAQRDRLGECVRRSAEQRRNADASRRKALQRVTAAVERVATHREA
ncbi:MAG TPA: hypothetical protein VFR07_18060 [Mycobacteriales bacterium]|nr:hypothetical protein [Mycobacteriales bacterium]